MKTTLRLVTLSLLVLATLGCSENEAADQAGDSGVLLDVDWASTGGSIPFRVSVNDSDNLRIGTITISSLVAEPGGNTSTLMDVELESMEVRFTRGDSGTRVPPPYVVNVLGTVPVNGTLTLQNWDVMSFEQLRTPPLSDLLFENGGFDKETGSTIIRLNLITRVYGTTRGGAEVASKPRIQTIEFTQ